jgi:DNA gyrase subunit A
VSESKIKLDQHLEEDFLEYSKYVNESRAIPELYDGLKPVARRILYTMFKMGLTEDKQTKKCSNIVGQTMAYHPHSDSGIYNALVRLTQEFSVKEPLIIGQGNFGSLELPPAASRYTEAKLSKLGESMTSKIKTGIVDMVKNFDGTEVEPAILPAPIPLLLINGVQGIGVGMATSIPTHNQDEVIELTASYLENPDMGIEKMLTILKGPDFNTGCEIVNKQDFLNSYRTGRGSFRMRAKFETRGNDLIISNLPYKAIASKIEAQIYKGKEEGMFKDVEGVTNISAQEEQLLISLFRKADVEALIDSLCRYTDAEKTVHLDFRAIHNGVPEVMSLPSFLDRWATIYSSFHKRELNIEKDKLERKVEITEGLIKASKSIDEVIAAIRESDNRAEAAARLNSMGFSELQTTAILDMRLVKLTKVQAIELEKEKQELESQLNHVNKLLTSTKSFIEYIAKEIRNHKNGVKRKSEVIDNVLPKITKKVDTTFHVEVRKGAAFVSESKSRNSVASGDKEHPVYILAGDKTIPIKGSDQLPIPNFHLILKDDELVTHVSSDGYVKRTKPSDLKTTREAIAVNQNVLGAFQGDGYIVLTNNKGERLQFSTDEISITGRGARGVKSAKLKKGEKITKVEFVDKPIKGVKEGRNKTMS